MTGDYTQAEIVRTLKRIEGKVDTLSANYLPRSEWTLWAEARDREIRDIKVNHEKALREITSARAPWWTWAAVLISFGSLAVTVLPKLVN